MRLVIVELNNGKLFIRPEGGLGTMGWSPKAWDGVLFDRRSRLTKHSVTSQFLSHNKLWTREDIDSVAIEFRNHHIKEVH
jgi:hypothetical protein